MMSRIAFEILKEQWGEYKLEDGLILKARFTVAFMQGDGAGVQFASADQLFVHAEEKHKGPANENARNLKRTEKIEKFHLVQNPRSIYLLDDGTVMDVRQSPVGFYRTNAFDANGLPVIQAEWSVAVRRQTESATPSAVE